MKTFDIITFALFGVIVALPLLLWVAAFVRDYKEAKNMEDGSE